MKKYLLSFCFLWIMFFSAKAQERLSLSDAIQKGLHNNYDIRIEEENVDVARVNNSWGEAGRFPTVDISIDQNNSLTDNVKTASPFQLQDITISNSLSPGVNINWVLFNGFKINMTKRRLDQLQAESEGNASIVIVNNIQSIILGYYLAVLEQERLDEFEKTLRLSSDRYEYTKTKSELGVAVTSDLLLEESNYLSDSVNYINQQLALRDAFRDLNVLLGEQDIDRVYILTDTMETDFSDYNYEELKDKMLDENVDLKKQYITQSILRTDIAINRADRFPTLAFNGGLSESRSRVDLSNASFPNDDGSSSPGPSEPLNAITDNYFANFTLSFRLFNGGKINRAIKTAMVQEDIGNIRIDQMKTVLERDLQAALDRYEVRKQLYGINERREKVAETNLSISEEKYRNGSINSFDFRVVQNDYLSASIQKLQALYNLIDAEVELMRLTGGILEEFKE